MRGLEPPRLAALAPKASVSTNSTTSADLGDERNYNLIATKFKVFIKQLFLTQSQLQFLLAQPSLITKAMSGGHLAQENQHMNAKF